MKTTLPLGILTIFSFYFSYSQGTDTPHPVDISASSVFAENYGNFVYENSIDVSYSKDTDTLHPVDIYVFNVNDSSRVDEVSIDVFQHVASKDILRYSESKKLTFLLESDRYLFKVTPSNENVIKLDCDYKFHQHDIYKSGGLPVRVKPVIDSFNLNINIKDQFGNAVDSASVDIKRDDKYSNSNGEIRFTGLPTREGLKITVTHHNYESKDDFYYNHGKESSDREIGPISIQLTRNRFDKKIKVVDSKTKKFLKTARISFPGGDNKISIEYNEKVDYILVKNLPTGFQKMAIDPYDQNYSDKLKSEYFIEVQSDNETQEIATIELQQNDPEIEYSITGRVQEIIKKKSFENDLRKDLSDAKIHLIINDKEIGVLSTDNQGGFDTTLILNQLAPDYNFKLNIVQRDYYEKEESFDVLYKEIRQETLQKVKSIGEIYLEREYAYIKDFRINEPLEMVNQATFQVFDNERMEIPVDEKILQDSIKQKKFVEGILRVPLTCTKLEIVVIVDKGNGRKRQKIIAIPVKDIASKFSEKGMFISVKDLDPEFPKKGYKFKNARR